MNNLILMDEDTYWIYHLTLTVGDYRVWLRLTDRDGHKIAGLQKVRLETGITYREKDELVASSLRCWLTINGKERATRVVGQQPQP